MAGYFLKIALLLLALRAADAGSQNFTKFTKAEEKFWNFAVHLYNHLKPEFENVTCPESPAANQEKLSHRAKSDPDITNNAVSLISGFYFSLFYSFLAYVIFSNIDTSAELINEKFLLVYISRFLFSPLGSVRVAPSRISSHPGVAWTQVFVYA